jgi:hypothetical protein
VGDYRLTKKYFLAAELEMKTKPLMMTDSILQQGLVSKVGFDYNAYENWLDMENIISIGFTMVSVLLELNSYKIYNANPYFGETPPVASGAKI